MLKTENERNPMTTPNIVVDDTYPGCPYCEQKSFVKCGVLYSLAVIKCLAEVSRVAFIPVLGVELKLKLVVTSKT